MGKIEVSQKLEISESSLARTAKIAFGVGLGREHGEIFDLRRAEAFIAMTLSFWLLE